MNDNSRISKMLLDVQAIILKNCTTILNHKKIWMVVLKTQLRKRNGIHSMVITQNHKKWNISSDSFVKEKQPIELDREQDKWAIIVSDTKTGLDFVTHYRVQWSESKTTNYTLLLGMFHIMLAVSYGSCSSNSSKWWMWWSGENIEALSK